MHRYASRTLSPITHPNLLKRLNPDIYLVPIVQRWHDGRQPKNKPQRILEFQTHWGFHYVYGGVFHQAPVLTAFTESEALYCLHARYPARSEAPSAPVDLTKIGTARRDGSVVTPMPPAGST